MTPRNKELRLFIGTTFAPYVRLWQNYAKRIPMDLSYFTSTFVARKETGGDPLFTFTTSNNIVKFNNQFLLTVPASTTATYVPYFGVYEWTYTSNDGIVTLAAHGTLSIEVK